MGSEQKPCILIVDDYEPLLEGARAILELEGYRVLTAADGVQALQVLERAHPDLIVADIMMPNMDGYAFYEAVRAQPQWVAIPFVFLTAKDGKEDMLRGKELGAEDYITKPFEPQNLLVTIQARLARAQAIRAAAQADFEQLKRQIVTILSHELRTPLNYVLGYTDLAIEEISSLSPDRLQECLRGVKQGANRLTRLVDDLLFLVRLDTGRAAEEFRVLARAHQDLGCILEQVLDLHRDLAAKRNVPLVLHVEPDLPPLKLCQPFFVEALSRLVENGIKFSRRQGRPVTLSACAAGDWVEVAVADEGVGIPLTEIPHLFERFRQIDREHMEQQGAGLGLAIAQELIALHGGEITVRSAPGEGSVFTIRLPAADTALSS